jgi:DNA invertase Pin-like site-specific DNA recombinase
MKDQNTNPNRKAVIYASQALANEQAMAQQIEAAHKIAADRGYTDCEIVSDQGSGQKIRPRLEELLRRVDAGEISHIFTVTPDRITRDSMRFQETTQRMTAAGTSLVTECDQKSQDTDPNATAMMYFRWAAGNEKAIAEQIAARLKLNAEQGIVE